MAEATKSLRIADALEKCDWAGCSIGNKEILRAAVVELRALSSHSAEAGKPVVKGLEWRTTDDRHDAGSIVGRYTIEGRNPGYGLLVPAPVAVRLFIDLEAAKAAAQADYERRIRSALSTPADSEPVAWRCEMGDQYWHYFTKEPRHKEPGEVWQPLYAAPVADREPVSVPEGWVLVPKTPTQEMLDAVTAADQHEPFSDGTMRDIFVEMCAAAPQPNPSTVDADRVRWLNEWFPGNNPEYVARALRDLP